MGCSFDTSLDPLNLQVFSGRLEYEDVDAHFSAVEQHCVDMAERDPEWRPALMADMRRAGRMDARGRQRIAVCFERLGPLMGDRVIGHAIVVGNRVGSGVLTAILWLRRPPWPLQAFADPEDAHAWLCKRFGDERREVPEAPPRWWSAAGGPRGEYTHSVPPPPRGRV